MRVPLSWLRDFAPFAGDPADLAATLDDLGLVVEETERVGEGLEDVVVARVEEITPIAGADKIRRVVVDAGDGPVEVVCGAWNFAVGDLVPLAPVGAVLPGGFAIGRRKMKGVASNGMLCSGRELQLSDDGQGILVLNPGEGARPGQPFTEAMGIEPDVVFDIAVEANRPDAWSIAGVARDLAARLGLPFAIPEVDRSAAPGAAAGAGVGESGPAGASVESLTSVRVEDLELCPRFTARVITGVVVGPSPNWLADRLRLAGMRAINNVVDASNYVMLELGQPTHPYDLDLLGGGGLLIRRAAAGETITTLDGVTRELGRPGPGLGDTGEDCLICDAEGTPVGIGGIMGGASSEIGSGTTRVLLETAYFDPMAIARTSKRLALRTEASARYERGCDPAGIDRAADRFCQLLALTAGRDAVVAPGTIDVRGDVPGPVELTVRTARVNELLGTGFIASEITSLLGPIGIAAVEVSSDGEADGGGVLAVTVPTFRPDIRPAAMGEADITEEVARTYGYARLPRRMPAWPQPGRLTAYQRDRRSLKEMLCGFGASEAWTTTFVSEFDQTMSGVAPPYIEVTNPLVEAERFLRTSMVPGLVRAVIYNTERRQGDLRLFEVGTVFHYPATPPLAGGDAPAAEMSERLCAVFCAVGDDAWTAVGAWRAVAEGLAIGDWDMAPAAGTPGAVLHGYRSAGLVSVGSTPPGGVGSATGATQFGVVGELDPFIVGSLGLLGRDGRPRRVGWLDLDIGVLLDRHQVPRRPELAQPISRFPSSDIDLAFAVDDDVSAITVERVLRRAGGEELESVELFDVFRGDVVGDGRRSLAYRLRFCSLDHTLNDAELAELRNRCIAAVETGGKATLR
ncbi:MAG TPA: phenylalanine--tRNA ligase subunit beta [Acidimicrobiales bacterium]|nr:phenylalanine--tRNA ligase subunit beta [Acidimicrobiales bacterium]